MADQRTTKRRPGVTPTMVEFPDAEYAAFREFVELRKSTLKAEILTAVRRHMASPPPLPEAVPLSPPRPRGRPRKNTLE